MSIDYIQYTLFPKNGSDAMSAYDVAMWVRWPAGLLACAELPRYMEEVEAFSHFDAAQRVMQQYRLGRVAHVAVGYRGVVKRWSFLRLVEDGEEA